VPEQRRGKHTDNTIQKEAVKQMNTTGSTQLREQLGDLACELGFEYEKAYGGCGQCTLLALQDIFARRSDDVFTALTGVAGGAGRLCDTGCGAYLGAIAFLGGLRGRSIENITDPQDIRSETHRLVQKLHAKFIEEYGTVICRDMHMGLFGRYFYMVDADERKKFNEAGAHTTVCTAVVGKACRWTVEIIIDAGLLSDAELTQALARASATLDATRKGA